MAHAEEFVDAAKRVSGWEQTDKTMCYAESTAYDLAETKVSNTAYDLCREFGNAWRPSATGAYEIKCEPCSTEGQARCWATAGRVICFNNRLTISGDPRSSSDDDNGERSGMDDSTPPLPSQEDTAAQGAVPQPEDQAGEAGRTASKSAQVDSVEPSEENSSSTSTSGAGHHAESGERAAHDTGGTRAQEAARREYAEEVTRRTLEADKRAEESMEEFQRAGEDLASGLSSALVNSSGTSAYERRLNRKLGNVDAERRYRYERQLRELEYSKNPTASNAARVAQAWEQVGGPIFLDHCKIAEWWGTAADMSSRYSTEAKRWKGRCSREEDIWDHPIPHWMTLGHGNRWLWSAQVGASSGVGTGLNLGVHCPWVISLELDFLYIGQTEMVVSWAGPGATARAAYPITLPWMPLSVGPAAEATAISSSFTVVGSYTGTRVSTGIRVDYRPSLERHFEQEGIKGFYLSTYIPLQVGTLDGLDFPGRGPLTISVGYQWSRSLVQDLWEPI